VTALCGLVSASALATREAAQATGLDVWPLDTLGDAGIAERLQHARCLATSVAA